MGMTLLHYVETCKLADNYISLPVKEDFKWMLEVPEEGEERKVYLAPDETSYMVGERYAIEDVGYLILARVGKVKDGNYRRTNRRDYCRGVSLYSVSYRSRT